MNQRPRHRKLVKHYHDHGDVHELTFSCYQQRPLLIDDQWRRMLAESLDRAVIGHKFQLVGFVFMPEHVHLLVYHLFDSPDIDGLLSAIKRPFSVRIKRLLENSGSSLLSDLTVRERPGKQAFRFWQEGPGYDRNLQSPKAVLASLDYIHANPVVAGLCIRAEDWKWSSARHYLLPNHQIDPDLPTIHGLPFEYLQ